MTKAEMELELSVLRNHVAALNANPAASVAVPGFVQAQAPAVAAPKARTWKRGGSSTSKAGYAQSIYTTPTKNGGEFRCAVPSDLIAAVKAGL